MGIFDEECDPFEDLDCMLNDEDEEMVGLMCDEEELPEPSQALAAENTKEWGAEAP